MGTDVRSMLRHRSCHYWRWCPHYDKTNIVQFLVLMSTCC